VVYVDLSEEEEKLILATLDPIAAMAGRDAELFKDLVGGMDSCYKDLVEATNTRFFKAERDAKAKPEQAGALRKQWGTESGQVWKIGQHRLLIGDALQDQTSFCRAAEGVCTDPPFEIDAGSVIRALEQFAPLAVVLCGSSQAFNLSKHWDMRLDLIWKHGRANSISNNQPMMFHAHVLVLAKSRDLKTAWLRPRADYAQSTGAALGGCGGTGIVLRACFPPSAILSMATITAWVRVMPQSRAN